MVKSELRRLTSDKKFLLIFFGVFAAMIILITIFLCTADMGAPLKDIDGEMAEYQNKYEFYRTWYLYSLGEGPCPGDPSKPPVFMNGVFWHKGMNYKDTFESYKYLIDTKTVITDYYVPGNLTEMFGVSPDYRGVSAMHWIALFSFYPLILFAIIFSVYTCVFPYEKGKMKNYFASPVGDRTIMGGKLFSLAAVEFFIWLIVFIWGLIFGCIGRPMYELCYTGNGYSAQSLFSNCVIYMLSTLVAMLFISCFTAFIGQFTKNSLATGASAVALVAISLALSMLIYGESLASVVEPSEAFGPFLVIGLYQVYYRISDYRLWTVLLFHIFVGAGMATFTILCQTKERYYGGSKVRKSKG